MNIPSSLVEISGSSSSSFEITVTSAAGLANGTRADFSVQVSTFESPNNVVATLHFIVVVSKGTVITKSRPFLLLDDSMRNDFGNVTYKSNIIQTYLNNAENILTKDLSVPRRWGAWSGKNLSRK